MPKCQKHVFYTTSSIFMNFMIVMPTVNPVKSEYYLELLMPETMKLLGSTKNETIKVRMVKMFLNQRLLTKYQSIVTLLAMIINKMEEFCIHLLQTNHLIDYQKFNQQILYFKGHIMQSFHTFKYDLLIKIIIRQRQKLNFSNQIYLL